MKKLLFTLACIVSIFAVQAQTQGVVGLSRKSGSLPFNPLLKPFYHGVASGDPLSDRVIIWTRVTPDTNTQIKTVEWKVATDTAMTNIVKSGTVTTDSTKDFTVKVDVTGLNAGTTYYYAFKTSGIFSTVGRTRTAPSGNVNHLRFAVVSCNNYEAGFFNGFGRIADRNDIDAVIHLGDYIYEYAQKQYGDTTIGRLVEPEKEIITEGDYRIRYSLYRLDPDLQRAHQQQAFISIWDDHESANDSYKDGADNHQPNTEGDWQIRKNISKKVYFEWMPIRDTTNNKIYRTIKYGDLAELIMLDTRLEGRSAPPKNYDDVDIPVRTILGDTQNQWFRNKLMTSTAKWKIIGNQVLFSTTNVGFAAVNGQGQPAPNDTNAIRATENNFIDNWESYPTERNNIIDYITNNNIKNVVIVTGDSHASWAFDVTKQPVIYPDKNFNNFASPSPSYTASTGVGSVAVEFGTPSITSANFDEIVGATSATQFEGLVNNPIPFLGNSNYNPHLKYVDLDRHGYIVLDLKADSAQANFYYVDKIKNPSTVEAFGKNAFTLNNSCKLATSNSPASQKVQQEIPAPRTKPSTVSVSELETSVVFHAYPNPTSDVFNIQYGLTTPQQVVVTVYDITGKTVSTWKQDQEAGLYNYTLYVNGFEKGTYIYTLQTEGTNYTGKFIVE